MFISPSQNCGRICKLKKEKWNLKNSTKKQTTLLIQSKIIEGWERERTHD